MKQDWLAQAADLFALTRAAFKALPSPSQLYTPPQSNIQTGFLTFPGWEYLEKQQGDRDQARVKTAVTSPWVFSNVSAIANEFSAAELIVKERSGSSLEDVENHPLELLWEAPNEHMGRSFLMKFWAWSYTMTGKAYLYWLPAQGKIQEVWPLPPFMVKPIPDTKEFIGGYLFKAREDSKPILIPREYITYSHSVNLFDIRDGLSFLAAAMTGIESDLAMWAWNKNFFGEQNGVPDGLITVGKDTLDPDLFRIREELRAFFGGTRRGVAVARSGDMDYKAFGRNQKEVEFSAGIELASKMIGRTLGFPDGYWSESANRANAEQARATMIAGAVWPLLIALSEDLNAGVVPRWFGDSFRAEFKDIRPEDRDLKLKEQENRKTHWTINELREADGKDPLEDPRGDMLVAEIAKGAPLPATPASDRTEEAIAKAEEEAGITGEEALPEEGAAMETAPAEGEEPVAGLPPAELKAFDLARWERKALKSLRRFHTADVRFESNAIPEEEQAQIREALGMATTPEAVKAAFKAEGDTDTLIDSEMDAAVDWARKALAQE